MSLKPWRPQIIANLRQRVVIQDFVTTLNDYNEEVQSWQNVATVWARIEPLKGDEAFAAGQTSAFKTVNIHIRHRTDIDTTMRIIHGGTTHVAGEDIPDSGSTIYNIVSLRNLDERQRYLSIDAKATA